MAATTADDVWRLLGELAEAQKETERRFQETERRFQETEHRFQEAERRFQETERLLKESSQAGERRFRETERLIQQTNQQLNQQIGRLGNRLGEFAEWKVRPAAVGLLQERGIAVHELAAEVAVQRQGEGLEIDLLAINETEAVLIEVKSKLSQDDVKEHLERLAKFKRLMPRYRDVRALGAIAALVVPEAVARYAYRQGLFVLAPSGDDMAILNDPQFQPRAW